MHCARILDHLIVHRYTAYKALHHPNFRAWQAVTADTDRCGATAGAGQPTHMTHPCTTHPPLFLHLPSYIVSNHTHNQQDRAQEVLHTQEEGAPAGSPEAAEAVGAAALLLQSWPQGQGASRPASLAGGSS